MLLCVDDSPAILRYERALFERAGFVVVTASSAREGLRRATVFHFDAVLLDYGLPDMNGHRLAVEIKRLQPETLLVMFSGREIPPETHRVVNAVIPKAGVVSELLPTIGRLLDLDSRHEGGASRDLPARL